MPYTPKPTPTTPTPTITNPTQGLTVDQLIEKLSSSKPSVAGSATDWYKTFPASLSTKDKIALQQTMLDLGLYGNTKKSPVAGLWNPDLDGDAFKKVVDIAVANNFFTTSGASKTPDYRKVLAIGAADPKAFSAMFNAPASGGYSGPSTTISTSRTKTDPKQLADTVNAAYLQSVGRAATEDEIQKAVNAVNKSAPSKTVTTTSRNKKGQAIVNSVTTPGANPANIIDSQVQADPGFGTYQAATTFFDAMLETLNGPVGRGA